MQAPLQEHWDAIMRIICYLKGCPGQGILLRSDCDISLTEAEYYSMAVITSELKWLKALLESLGIQQPRPMTIFCDGKSALHIAQSPVFHERTKHIKVNCHYIRDALQDGIISTLYVSTNEQLADIFTKALSKQKFIYLVLKLGICNLHALT
ncbi:hypothetical protein LIER_33642 [Lithospermum erythrorhizon]|uniref:Retrovirus-related Pol polyprotein from transposon TNT 1-94 n=1 Tax=Lithospermum erythrorhizon TaxID=34254 RepID=A0AAV3RY73_LITER